MHCVLAVDGGNTKTIAVVAALDGAILGAGYAGCSDVYNAAPDDGGSTSAEAARQNTERAVAAALAQAGVSPADLDVGVFNMAGADWPEDLAFWRETAERGGLGREVIVQNDALGVLYLASPEAIGVSIVGGTGVATGARAADGRTWHSSFWQDEAQGSGHLGQKMLFAVYRSALGIEPPTSLTERVLAALDVSSVEEALHYFTNRLQPATIKVDRLTPILLDEAHDGDSVARRVVSEHGRALGDIALAAARKVGLDGVAYPLVFAGGIFRHPTTVLEDAIVAHVRATSPAIRPIRSRAEPIVGVLVEALGAAGTQMSPGLLDRMLASVPELVAASTGTVERGE